jgi:hypothetical protein
MDGTDDDADGDPEVAISRDEFGPLNLQPHPGRQWSTRGGGGAPACRRRRATYTRPHGVRHLLAAYDLLRDRLYGHIKPRKRRGEFLVFLRYARTLYPPGVRLEIVLDNFSPHLSTRTDRRIADWAATNNVELAYVPHQRFLAEPDPGAVPGAALFHLGRHRPRQPPAAGQHDSPLHRLAKPTRPQSATTRNRRQGEGS